MFLIYMIEFLEIVIYFILIAVLSLICSIPYLIYCYIDDYLANREERKRNGK